MVGTDNEKIGDVSDILFDKDGKIEALRPRRRRLPRHRREGRGARPERVPVVPGDKSKNEFDKLKLSMTKDELKQAVELRAVQGAGQTTGMGGGPGSRRPPAGGGMAR